MSEAVAKRYASALFEVVQEKGLSIDKVETELQTVNQIVAGHKDLKVVLNHPQIGREDKKALLEGIFKNEVSQEVLNLLKVLVDGGREGVLEDLKEQYIAIANEHRGIVDMTVTTASPLTKEDEEKLAAAFSRHLNKQLRIHAKVDPKVIGGVLVKIGNRLYDGTLAGKLDRFSKELKASR
jgi:F-type H+-transporting ATPase subunit delta